MKFLLILNLLIIGFAYGCIERFFVLRPLKWKLLKYIQDHYPDVALNLEWFNFKPLKGIPNEGQIIMFSFWDKYHIKDTEINNLRCQIRKSVIRHIAVIIFILMLLFLAIIYSAR